MLSFDILAVYKSLKIHFENIELSDTLKLSCIILNV